MDILDVLAAKRNLARRVVKDLVEHYKTLDDTERLEKSNTILDEVNSYLQIEENQFFPFIRKTGEHEDLIRRIKDVHTRLEEVSEHAIMMHVDEPSGEYFHCMVKIGELLELAKRADDEILFPWAMAYLSEEDQYQIATHLKNEMVQESLPSSGMTVY